jgi:guanylate kinase
MESVPPPLLIVGPSGVGKSTFIQKLFVDFPNTFKFSVSATCRSMRPGEADGVNYHFLTKTDFEAKIAESDFLEFATVHDYYYGTLK